MAYYQYLMAWLDERQGDEGQGLVEYALIIALVAILCIGALTAIQGGIDGTLDSIAGTLGGGEAAPAT